MNTFSLAGKERIVLIALMILGVLCLGATYMIDDELHTRFWSNILHNTVFFTGIAFMALFFLSACITAWAGWHAVFKRVWESFSIFLVVGLILMAIIALGMILGWHHLYHWADSASVATDDLLQHKSKFLNFTWFGIICLIIVGIWYLFAIKIRNLSLAEDERGDSDFTQHKKMRIWAAAFLPVGGFSSAAVIWLWVMSVDAHWYSTLFAWYSATSWFVAMICLTILLLMYLKNQGYYERVSKEHIHDLGKYLFAFSIFWTYLWFSQYMLIWYGNIGEETVYFQIRREEYPVLFYGNLFINFVLPFLILMRNDTKRKYGSVGFVAAIVFFGHWIDYFLMLKPGILHTAHEVLGHHGQHTEGAAHADHASPFVAGFTLPGLLEIGILLGFLGLFLFVALRVLAKAPLVAEKDPYLEESIHHHV
ncbi:MAG: hypothetical protein R3275_08910 [Saprospiraceae bacterium]|nr:hypothetical protein [Saprospiraceae bacterium]